jgi:Chitobiase/beta-hexosaminidase C-terminal domain
MLRQSLSLCLCFFRTGNFRISHLLGTVAALVMILCATPKQAEASAASALQFIPIAPCRIVDTRNPTGAFGGPELAAGAARTFDVPQSDCDIPATAVAYSLNVTVVPIAALGYLTVYPAGEAQPGVSTLNSDGRVKANATITPAGTNGGVSVYASDATQFILDIDGYFVLAGTSSAGLEFFPLTPCRIADTRNPDGALGGPFIAGGTSRAFPVQSSDCGLPATAQAYSLNVTAVPHGSLGYLTAWPTGESQSVASTLNSSTGAVTANAAIVPAGTGGDVSIYASNDTDVILDVNGYFAAPATGGLALYTVTPCRVLDTRYPPAAGVFDGTLAVPVHASACAPPATAQAYVLNATVVPPEGLGYLTLYPNGAALPGTSTLNASDGAITSNMAIVPTNNGIINAFAADPTQLILDLSSYFASSAVASTPTFSPAAGTYATGQTVTISDATAGAVIYYTTNGTAPTTASTKYTAAISVSASETLEAIAVATDYANSAVASAKYTITSPAAATPTFSVPSGTYSTAQSVQISDATPGATIYYTTNGAAPTPASAVYKSAVNITATGYLQAIAVADGYATSAIASALYSIGADITATPVLSPAPGAYGKSQTVTITDATPGAVVTYSVGIGSVVNTYTYTGPFTVSSTEYIAYDAIAPGYTRSAALEGIYTIGTVPTPQFSPAAGTYSTAQAVNIYDITPGATIYYTTDGTTPTTASAVYTSPIIVSANQTIHAFAAVSGLTSSAPVSAAYTIGKGVATPTFSLAPGSYTNAQSVAITDITPGATIYYTTTGSAPTTSSTKYTGPISVTTTETIEAIAVAPGDTNSAVASAAYTIGYPIATVVATASGTDTLTVPVGGSSAFAVASENESGSSYPSVTVKTTTGSNPTLPVQVTICQTNPSSGQCLAAPGPTVTVAPFANGATPTFSVFVTATAAIPSSPSNQIVVLFTNPSGTLLGSASVLVVTN